VVNPRSVVSLFLFPISHLRSSFFEPGVVFTSAFSLSRLVRGPASVTSVSSCSDSPFAPPLPVSKSVPVGRVTPCAPLSDTVPAGHRELGRDVWRTQRPLGRGRSHPPAGRLRAHMHVPLICRQPGCIPAGATNDFFVSNYDFLPTVLSYLGLAEKSPKNSRRAFRRKQGAPPVRLGDNLSKNLAVPARRQILRPICPRWKSIPTIMNVNEPLTFATLPRCAPDWCGQWLVVPRIHRSPLIPLAHRVPEVWAQRAN